jgi:formate dehydrogenase subunit gamma
MSDAQATEGKRARRFKAMLWSIVLIAVGSMTLPLAGYLYTAAVQAQEQAAGDAANPRSEYWREVRGGMAGYTAVVGQETDVLIQSRGQVWREIRNGPVATLGAIMVLGMLVVLAAFHLIKGGAKLEHRTGRTVLRWPMLDRVLHWYTAILFIILAITGMSLLWGRIVLIPLLGKEGFAAWANFAKPVHDYLALFFTAGLVVMLLKWFKYNLFTDYDWQWFKQAGGYLDGSHPRAGFANAGEKAYYWLLVIGGTAIVVSGFYMLFPNLGFERATMQNANIIHGISSLVVIAAVFAHIYLGTLGSEGALEGMVSGEVDEGWAKQHHSVWLEEVKKQGAAPAREGDASGTSATASA